MEIFKFLILGYGYKLINVSKNIKIDRKRNFRKSRNMIVKIQVKSKPAVINALNKSKYLFFVTQQVT